MRPRSLILLAATAIAAIALVFMGGKSPKPRSITDTQLDPPEEVPEEAPVPADEPPARVAPQPLVAPMASAAVRPNSAPPLVEDERAFMTKLRSLTETEPAKAVELARRGNTLYPSGTDGAERGWVICKALTNLGRFDEAHEEAKLVAEKYPDTPWTLDVVKHILINPRTHPSERGYGKKSEFD